MQEDLHRFRQRCGTCKALAVAIAEDDGVLAGRRAARLLQAGWAPAKVLGHLCDAWSVQAGDAQDEDAAALAALGVVGPKMLQALNDAGYLPSYNTGRRHVEGTRRVRPNEPPGLPWLLEALGHIPGCHVWHLCIDEIHVEDVITVSREALAVGLCAMCCRHPMPLASSADVEVLAQRLEQNPDTYHAANQATVVFLAPHTEKGYYAIPLWVIPTCGRFKAEHCHTIRKHMAELCGNAAFRDRHGFLLSAHTDGDARRSRRMQGALYAEGADTLSWMPEIPHIPFQTDEFRMCGNFDPPHLMKRVSHMLGGASLILQGELSYGVLQELHNNCDDPKPVLSPLPQDKEEVKPTLDLLKSMAAIGRIAPANLNLSPPLVHAAGDAVVLGIALEKFIGRVYNTELSPTVAVENIA